MEIEQMEVEKIKIKPNLLQKITINNDKKNDNTRGPCFDFLDENYFKEYDICIHKNTFKSDRYIRLANAKVNEFDIRIKKKRIRKKKVKKEFENFFEFQYPNDTLVNMRRCESIKNSTDSLCSKEDNNFKFPCISQHNINIEKKEYNGNESLPLINKTDINSNKRKKIVNSDIDRNKKQSTLKKNTIFNNNKNNNDNNKNYSNKRIKSDRSDISDHSNNLSYNDNDEFFSTELLLEDNEDIFHANEDLFTTEPNYNTRNLKYLENFEKIRNMKEEQEKRKGGKENYEDNTGNTLELYTTLKRKNIKKISSVMKNTKNMTKNKSIYINFDYSDNECSDKSFIYSSEDDKQYEELLNKKSLKRTYDYSNNSVTKSDIKPPENLSKIYENDSEIKVDSSICKNESDEMIIENNNESKNDDEIKVDSSTDKNELNKITDEINSVSKNDDEIKVDSSTDKNELNKITDEINSVSKNDDEIKVDSSTDKNEINKITDKINSVSKNDDEINSVNKNDDEINSVSKNDDEIKVDSSTDKNELNKITDEINNVSKNDDEISVDSNINKNEIDELTSETSSESKNIDSMNHGNSKVDLYRDYKIYKNKELRNYAEILYKESYSELFNKNTDEENLEEVKTENRNEGLSKYISVNLEQNNQKRKNYVIDKKRQLRKCRDLLNKRREEFDRKEEQKKRERDQNIDSSEQNLKMTNVIKNIIEKLKHNKNIFKLNKDLIQTNMDDKLKDLNLEELNNIYHKELEELKGKNYDIIPSNIRFDLLRQNIIKMRIVNCPRMNNIGICNEELINSLREEKKNQHIPQKMYLELKQMFSDEYNTLKQILKSKKQNSIDILTDLNININNKNEKLQKYNGYSESNIYNNINNNENSVYNYYKSLCHDHSKHVRFHRRHNNNNISKSNNNKVKNNKFKNNKVNNQYISFNELKRTENDKGGIIKKYKKILPAISLRRYKVSKLPKVKFDKNKNNKINKVLNKNEKLFEKNKTDTSKKEKENKLEYLKYKSNYIIKHTIVNNEKYNSIPTPYSSLDYDLYIACNQHKYVNTVKSIINKRKKEERLIRGKRKEKYHIQPNMPLKWQLKNSKIDNSNSSIDDNKPFIEEGTDLYHSVIYHPEVLKKIIMNIYKNKNNINTIYDALSNNTSNNEEYNSVKNKNTEIISNSIVNNSNNNNNNNNNNDNNNDDDDSNDNKKEMYEVNSNETETLMNNTNDINNVKEKDSNLIVTTVNSTNKEIRNNKNNTYIQNLKNNINLNKMEESKNNNKQKNKKDILSNNIAKVKKSGNTNNNNKFKTRVNETNIVKPGPKSTEIYNKIKKEKVNSQSSISKKLYNKNRKMKKDTNTINDNSIKKANEINNKNSKLVKSSGTENSKEKNILLDNNCNNNSNNNSNNYSDNYSDNNSNNNSDNSSDNSRNNDNNNNNNNNNIDKNIDINNNDNDNNNVNLKNIDDNDDDNNENNNNNNNSNNNNNNNNNDSNENNLEKTNNENNNSLSDSILKMCKKNKYIKSKLRAEGVNIEEHRDLIIDILNDNVPKSTDDIEYIRVNDITEKETNLDQKIKNNNDSKNSKIMEEFQKINESNKHVVYDYIGLDKNDNFYDCNDIIANIDPKDKFYKEIVIFDDTKKFKEMMNDELIKRYNIKPHPNEEINENMINDTVNCAFSIMGHNRERKTLIDDEKTVWHQQINEATNLYNRLIGLGIDVDKRVIMNAIVSPKDVLHLNKDSSFIKNLRKVVEENRRKKLLAAKKLSKSKENSLNRGKGRNYEINYLNKFKNSKWNSVHSKVDSYNQLIYNSTLRNMVKDYVKKRKECRKEIKENQIIDVIPFISSFPRHYRIESNDECFETNFFYSDNYINPYHNYSCLFIDDMGIFSCFNDYYL